MTPEQIAKSGSEAAEQKALFAWIALNQKQYPQLLWLAHIPNGGYRNAREGANLKAQGVRPGYPDLALMHPTRQWHGCFIEMKRKGGKVSEEQTAWLNHLFGLGYSCHVCYSWQDAVSVLKRYLEDV